MLNQQQHATATGTGFYYSNYDTATDILDRIARRLDESGVEIHEVGDHYAYGQRFKVTITIERD